MSELQSLLAQKETLTEQMRRISETCEGIENPENAAKVAALNEEQLKLSAQKSDFQGKVATLDRELVTVSNKIQELSGSGVEKILNAIKNQRWFFFKNKPKVLMDRDTALLWPNLNYYIIDTYRPYNASYDFSSYEFDGMKNWDFPSNEEVKKLLEDYSFPYCKNSSGSHEIISPRGFCISRLRVNNYSNTCTMLYYYSNDYFRIQAETGHTESSCCLPRSTVLVPTDYEKNISPQNKIYSETEKLQMTLNIFVSNNLEPIFDNEEITELYRQIYIVKPEVQKKLSEVQQEIDKLNEVELISPKVDWLALKTKFDCGAEKSLLKYAESIKNLTEHLQTKFEGYTQEKSEVLAEMQKISAPNELVPDVEKVFADIDSFLDDALTLKKSLLTTRNLTLLAELKAVPRPTFDLVAETLTEKVRQVLLQVEFFESQPEFVKSACAALNLKFEFEGEFLKQFRRRDRVTHKFILQLVNYVMAGHLQKKNTPDSPTLAEIVLEHIEQYRQNLAGLYTNATEEPEDDKIFAKVESLQKNLEEVLQSLDDETERRYLAGKMHRLQIEVMAAD